MEPAQVRELRGAASRAAFARELGVTPNTVYRWELPATAAESRSPRGALLDRLTRLARGEALEQRAKAGTPAVSSNDGSPENPHGRAQTEDLATALLGLERVYCGDAKRGQSQLVGLLATGRPLPARTRALASSGIALANVVLTADAKSALVAISPALADADAGLLESTVAARVYAVAALVRSMPLGQLFDQGHVHALAARAEAEAGLTDPETTTLALLATLAAALLVADRELLERAYLRLEEVSFAELRPLVALHLEEFQGLRPMLAGKATAATTSFEALAERARAAGYPMLAARALAHQAQCDLDSLAPPEHALELVRQGQKLAGVARAECGLHQVLLARAEGEACLRLGRTEEALAAVASVVIFSDDMGLPPFAAIPTCTRIMTLSGRFEGFTALASRLRDCEVAALRPICRAYLAYLEAMASLGNSADPEAMTAAFERAEEESRRWPFLLRHLLPHRVTSHVVNHQEGQARLVLRRAQRVMDAYPAPWSAAYLRRVEGTLLAGFGQWSEGRHLIESAIATFELAGDRCDAALSRYLLAAFSETYDERGGADLAHEQRAALEALGLRAPSSIAVGMERLRAVRNEARDSARSGAGSGAEALVVPLQRLSVRGALPSLILRELLSIVQSSFPDRIVRLDELDSAGKTHAVATLPPPRTSSAELHGVEFSDGAGRAFRLGLSGQPNASERALLSVLSNVTSLALEAATLRGYEERRAKPAADDRLPEMPGFLAASAVMRRLRAELVRLTGSSATVIITGESGVGKEVVARAIHELSDRARKSYVAFNCATVPRELFEGQLFGYRRGAFTGANADQPGVIRAAHGGTLFLDEIGELPLDIQPKLLRFLENGEVFPLGEQRPLRVDVRVLAATHRNLAELVRAGRFREDLYYRLQVVPIHVPPLRERREDVPVLARHFLRELRRQGEPPVLSPDAVAVLVAHDWPGNVRELRNVVERALAFSPTPSVLRGEHLQIDAGKR